MLFGLFSAKADEERTSGTAHSTSLETAARIDALKEAVVCEAHSAALLTATLTSGINSLTHPAVRVGPAELRAFAPGDLSRLGTLHRLMLESDFTRADTLFLDEFLAGARVGDKLLECYFHDADKLGGGRAAVLHKTGLSEAWRQICHLAIIALKELDAEIAPDLPEIYVQNSRVVAALLAGAKNGWRPCIDARGQLHLPPLPQQRRWPRRALLQLCSVTHRAGTTEAFARDVSAGGSGLDQMPPVARGDQLTVELACGRKLRGTVAWTIGAAAGLRFPAELKPADPLLMG